MPGMVVFNVISREILPNAIVALCKRTKLYNASFSLRNQKVVLIGSLRVYSEKLDEKTEETEKETAVLYRSVRGWCEGCGRTWYRAIRLPITKKNFVSQILGLFRKFPLQNFEFLFKEKSFLWEQFEFHSKISISFR